MTFKELNFFYKLCENPKVSSVASELEISQSAISIAVKSLEEKLGESLFDRIGKRLVLNERGRAFYNMTYTHFIALNDAKNMFKTEKLEGHIRVGSSRTISGNFMPDIYYGFLSQYSKVNLDIHTMNSGLIVQQILNGELDVGIIETNCDEVDIIKNPILDDELLIVTADKEYKKVQYIDSITKKWILREKGSGTRDMFINTLEEFSKEINIFMELYEVNEIKQLLVKYPDTISAMSKITVIDEIEKGILHNIKIKNFKFERTFYMIYHKNKTKSMLFERFIKHIKDSFDTFAKATHK